MGKVVVVTSGKGTAGFPAGHSASAIGYRTIWAIRGALPPCRAMLAE
jgi:hypothetical protein